ncbi:hypothetical protein HNR23_003261 [Nocardiopsis mwathae]|uniref:DUF397 domain-containing protein n=1 Tax=Nocardiopsis mwathae TaxID=1472723 RepID=A0A7W9YL55_9ACTN|nr:DUF397 domain-containing protein [Nocardiopsis mwathae]MBB6173201.1 hypothetical protein [Nocardiopsis mwathae]
MNTKTYRGLQDMGLWRKSSYSGPNGCVEVARLPLRFRKSSYSQNKGQCVEVADLGGGAAVRDSVNPRLGHLAFASVEWSAFLQAVKGDALEG